MSRLLVPAGVGMIAVAFGLARYGFGLLLPDMRTSLDIDPATAGLVGSSAYVSYLLANALVVALTVRTGPRVPLFLATGCAAGGMATIAGADSVSGLALGVLLAGASAGFAFPPYADVVAGSVPERRRSTAWASISSGTGWGVAVAGPVAVVAGAEWRTAWWVFAAIALVVGSTAVLSVPAVRPTGPAERSGSGRAGSCARSRGRCCCPLRWWVSAARSGRHSRRRDERVRHRAEHRAAGLRRQRRGRGGRQSDRPAGGPRGSAAGAPPDGRRRGRGPGPARVGVGGRRSRHDDPGGAGGAHRSASRTTG